MHKRIIDELYKHAYVPHTAIDPSNNMPYETTCFSANKFAELIVQDLIDSMIKRYGDDDELPIQEIKLFVKEHFGVEE